MNIDGMTNEQRDKLVSKMLSDVITIKSVDDAEYLVQKYGTDCSVAVAILLAMRCLDAGENTVTLCIHSDDDVNANALVKRLTPTILKGCSVGFSTLLLTRQCPLLLSIEHADGYDPWIDEPLSEEATAALQRIADPDSWDTW
jgi:hypothetical protein